MCNENEIQEGLEKARHMAKLSPLELWYIKTPRKIVVGRRKSPVKESLYVKKKRDSVFKSYKTFMKTHYSECLNFDDDGLSVRISPKDGERIKGVVEDEWHRSRPREY